MATSDRSTQIKLWCPLFHEGYVVITIPSKIYDAFQDTKAATRPKRKFSLPLDLGHVARIFYLMTNQIGIVNTLCSKEERMKALLGGFCGKRKKKSLHVLRSLFKFSSSSNGKTWTNSSNWQRTCFDRLVIMILFGKVRSRPNYILNAALSHPILGIQWINNKRPVTQTA